MRLTDDELSLLGEAWEGVNSDLKGGGELHKEMVGGNLLIFRDLEVERCRTTPYATRDIIVGAVAGAEPTPIVTSLANRHTTYIFTHQQTKVRVINKGE